VRRSHLAARAQQAGKMPTIGSSYGYGRRCSLLVSTACAVQFLLDRAEDRPARTATGSPDNLDQATMLGEAPSGDRRSCRKNQPRTP